MTSSRDREKKLGAEMLQNLEEIITEELKIQLARRGLLDDTQRQKVASDLGRQLADFLSLSWGGQQVYIPKDNKRRAAIIYDEFDGTNVSELARKYDLCIQTIYKIIRRERKARSMTQCSLLNTLD